MLMLIVDIALIIVAVKVIINSAAGIRDFLKD